MYVYVFMCMCTCVFNTTQHIVWEDKDMDDKRAWWIWKNRVRGENKSKGERETE